MKLPTLFLLFILLLIGAFTALNWQVFIAPADLSLAFTTVRMPLGLIMLAILVTLTCLFLAFVVYLQGSVLLEARRHSRELQSNRELADKAEASRFTELRTFLDEELVKQALQNGNAKASILAKMDKCEEEIKTALEQSSNSLAAYIGELEDRLENKHSPNAR